MQFETLSETRAHGGTQGVYRHASTSTGTDAGNPKHSAVSWARSSGLTTTRRTVAASSTDPDAAFLRAAPWPLWIWQYGPVFGAFAQMLLIGAVTWVHMLLMG